jgi:endonuclease YncB( thermonuclease family)
VIRNRFTRLLFAVRNLSIVLAVALVCLGLVNQPSCRAVDGESMVCGWERIRLHRVHAPAIDLPGGKAARQRLQQRIDSGKIMVFRIDRDLYGRTVGMVYVNGELLRQAHIHQPESFFAARASDARKASFSTSAPVADAK